MPDGEDSEGAQVESASTRSSLVIVAGYRFEELVLAEQGRVVGVARDVSVFGTRGPVRSTSERLGVFSEEGLVGSVPGSASAAIGKEGSMGSASVVGEKGPVGVGGATKSASAN